MSERYQIKVTSKTQAETIFNYLISLGYRVDLLDAGRTVSGVAAQYVREYPYISIGPKYKNVGGNCTDRTVDYPERFSKITMEEIFDGRFDKAEPIKVTLNDEYTATFHADHFEVGCQSFDFSVIDRLVEARNKATEI